MKISYIKVLGVIILGAVVFWALAVLSYKYFGFALSAENVVLTFVGIVATFVVISNYMQVQEVKSNFESKLFEIINTFDEKVKEVQDNYHKELKIAKDEVKVYTNKISKIKSDQGSCFSCYSQAVTYVAKEEYGEAIYMLSQSLNGFTDEEARNESPEYIKSVLKSFKMIIELMDEKQYNINNIKDIYISNALSSLGKINNEEVLPIIDFLTKEKAQNAKNNKKDDQ